MYLDINNKIRLHLYVFRYNLLFSLKVRHIPSDLKARHH